MELLFKDEVYAIVGAAMEVHAELGCGFLEAVYQEAMQVEMTERGLPFYAQHWLHVVYKGRRLQKKYCADFVCFERIIVELKAADALTEIDESQIINYLKATGFRIGILINFGAKRALEWKRFVN